MPTRVVTSKNPLVTVPFNDPDAVAPYNETPTGSELEIRVANAVPGAGSLIELRSNTVVGQIPTSERIGQQIDALTAIAGFANDTNVAVAAYSATNPTGYAAASSLEVQATGASSTDRGSKKTLAGLNLAVYGSGALIKCHRRITSVTNLVRWSMRFEFNNSAVNFADFELAGSGAALNTWAEMSIAKGAPTASGGNVDWSNVTAIYIRADVSGAYTGNIQIRDLRIGTTQTAKTVPDGHMAWESTYDIIRRYWDAAGPSFKVATPWQPIKVSQPPGATNQAPSGTVTDPTPVLDWNFTSAGGKAQAGYLARLFWRTGAGVETDEEVWNSGFVPSSTTQLTVPAYRLVTGRTYAWEVVVTDTDGLTSDIWAIPSRTTFTTNFATPADVTAASAVADLARSEVTLSWTAPVDANHYETIIYRRNQLGEDIEIRRVPAGTNSWVDKYVPHNRTSTYRLVASTGAVGQLAVGVPVEVLLDTHEWMHLARRSDSATFVIPHTSSISHKPELDKERLTAPGRTYPLYIESDTVGGTVRFFTRLERANELLLALFEEAARTDESIIKDGAGHVWVGEIVSLDEGWMPAAGYGVTVELDRTAEPIEP